MKRILLSFVLLSLWIVAPARSCMWHDAMNPSTAGEVRYALSLAEYAVCENQYSRIAVGASSYFYRTFFAGEDYRIVAFSEDDDVLDVDVMLYEADGTLYDQDTDNSGIAVVDFSPARTRTMKVVFKNYRSYNEENASLCRVLIGRK